MLYLFTQARATPSTIESLPRRISAKADLIAAEVESPLQVEWKKAR
jgi:hypothetical protein